MQQVRARLTKMLSGIASFVGTQFRRTVARPTRLITIPLRALRVMSRRYRLFAKGTRLFNANQPQEAWD